MNNPVIVIANPLLLRLVFPLLAVDMAMIAHERGWRLLNILELPYWLEADGNVLINLFGHFFNH